MATTRFQKATHFIKIIAYFFNYIEQHVNYSNDLCVNEIIHRGEI